MPHAELVSLSAAQAAALIRRRSLSPVEYMRAVLAAAHAAQPRFNPFVAVLDDAAMQGARAAEQAVMDGARLGPLHGVPVSIKDQVDVAGVPTTHGSAIFADNMPPGDDAVVTRLRAAGAVVFAKTRLPEVRPQGHHRRPQLRRDAEPVEPGADDRRVQRRRGGGAGGGRRADRARHGRGRLHTHPGGVLRAGGAETDPGRGAVATGFRRVRQLHLCRADGAYGDGRGADAGCLGRPQRRRPLDGQRRSTPARFRPG